MFRSAAHFVLILKSNFPEPAKMNSPTEQTYISGTILFHYSQVRLYFINTWLLNVKHLIQSLAI